MEQFQNDCRRRLMSWFEQAKGVTLDFNDTYVVWSCKALQNFKCLVSTNVDGDTTYAEYTYNGDKQEVYEDIYIKAVNQVHVVKGVAKDE